MNNQSLIIELRRLSDIYRPPISEKMCEAADKIEYLSAELEKRKQPVFTNDIEDDCAAIDRFSLSMKEKMYQAYLKGREGWDDPGVCSGELLAKMLVEHLTKGNAGTFEDVANFAMMLHQRGEDPMVLKAAVDSAYQPTP